MTKTERKTETMINENLHKKVVALDRMKHRELKLDLAARDMSASQKLNAFFVAGTEFGDACREYPVVWVNAGNDDTGWCSERAAFSHCDAERQSTVVVLVGTGFIRRLGIDGLPR
jgi:hypothetical protein